MNPIGSLCFPSLGTTFIYFVGAFVYGTISTGAVFPRKINRMRAVVLLPLKALGCHRDKFPESISGRRKRDVRTHCFDSVVMKMDRVVLKLAAVIARMYTNAENCIAVFNQRVI